jgi:hypothetical protein
MIEIPVPVGGGERKRRVKGKERGWNEGRWWSRKETREGMVVVSD